MPESSANFEMCVMECVKRVRPSFRAGFFIGTEMLMRGLLRRSSRIAFRLQKASSDGLAVFNALMFFPLIAYKVHGKVRRLSAQSRDVSEFHLD